MLHFARWKIIAIILVCVAGMVFTLPNLLSRAQVESLPSWLQPVNLGLDLQGGSHLLLEVETDAAFKEQLTGLVDSIRTILRKERIRYADLAVEGQAAQVRILDAESRDQAADLLRDIDAAYELDQRGDGLIVLGYTPEAAQARQRQLVEQSIEIVRRRVDELGTREPTIVRQGDDRIVVQLPGLDDPERIKSLLGQTAKLTFHLLDGTTSVAEARMGRIPPGSMLVAANDGDVSRGLPESYVLRRRVELGGEALTDAQATFQQSEPVVSFKFDTRGAKKFGQITQENVGRPFAIVLDEKVISAPVIREPILGGSGVISGNFTTQEAQDLALLLRAGALPAPLTILEERTVGPELGADSIRAGTFASILGLVLVMLFMAVTYGGFGAIAISALVLNLALLLGALSLLGATLTLPGIAGIVLTMGMAVDANVLIFERMREERRNGRTVINALDAGFKRAFTTILDSNVTTLVAALLLFQFGSGPVRGFAVTLAIGLLTSMFTAIMVTRLIIATWARSKRPKDLPI